MPELKYNTTPYEIFYLKNRRLFIIVAIVATILLVAFTFWLLQNLGFINNADLKDVKYTVQDYQPNEKYSILSNQELAAYKNGGVVKLNIKNVDNSLVALINDKSEIVAINDTFNKDVKFSNVNTFKNLITNSPYYLFLDNEYKKQLNIELDKLDFTQLKTKLNNSNLASLLKTQEYLDILNLTNKNPAIQKIVSNYYAKLNQTTLPGYTNSNKTYPYSLQLDNYSTTYPGKFSSAFGLNIINDKNIPRVDNHATFYQNLDLTEKNKTSTDSKPVITQNTYNINQLIVPTFYSRNLNPNPNQLEELKIPTNFPEVLNEYNLNSKQLSGDVNIPNALSYNLSKYMSYAFKLIESKNIVRSVENFDQLSETYVKDCASSTKTPQDLLNCYQQKLDTDIYSRFKLEKNNSTDNYLKILKDLYLGQLTIDTQFDTSLTTSPEASFLHFLRGTDVRAGNVKMKPPFSSITAKFGIYNIQYDGAFETLSEDNVDKSLKIVFNQRNILINLDYIFADTTKYFCTNDLDVAKIDNTLYKSFDAKWENGKLELKPEVVNYYKTESKYIQNLKNDVPAALKEVSEADASTFKNCFNASNLGTLYKGNLIKIQAKKQDNSKFTEEETILIDKFVSTLVIDKN
jgi:hypothetical protein